MRVAHRARIDIYLTELSEDIHTVIAGITIIRKRVAIGSDTSQWQATAKAAGNRIEIIRRRTRYVFEGFDESLRQFPKTLAGWGPLHSSGWLFAVLMFFPQRTMTRPLARIFLRALSFQSAEGSLMDQSAITNGV